MGRASPVGYSGRSLAEKLGLRPGGVLCAIGAPVHYASLLEPLPAGASLVAQATEPDLVHAFFHRAADLSAAAAALVLMPRAGGSVWVSWPKKTSPLFVDLTEGGVRDLILPTGWVDVKVCAVDADWSALKFLRRR